MSVRIIDGLPWVGDRSFPWASGVDYNDHGEFRERRFRLTFENGWTLSIVFGSGTYSSNRDAWSNPDSFSNEVGHVEVAAWPRDGDMVMWEDSGDTVKGWVPEPELLTIIEEVSQRPSPPAVVPADEPASHSADFRGES